MARKRPPSSAVGDSRFAAYRPVLDRLIFGLALLGVLVTVHLWIQQERGFDQGCFGFSASQAVEDTFNCEAVVESDAGTLLGLSNVVWGLLFYLGVAALSAGVFFVSPATRVRLKQARAAIIAAGLGYSAYLIFYQYFVLSEFCALCLTSALIVTALALLQGAAFFTPSPQTRMQPMPRRREVSFVAALAVLLLVLVGADLAYFNSLDEPAIAEAEPVQTAPAAVSGEASQNPVSAECSYNEEIAPITDYESLLTFSDPMKGSNDAPVTVIEVFEPNCPHCRLMHPIMEKVAADYGDKARFYFKPVVFWPQRSMLQLQALYIAAQEGKFFEMLDQQFRRQQPRTGHSIDQLKQMASNIGLDADAMAVRIQQGDFRSAIMQQRKAIVEDRGITSVPAVLINGRVVDGPSRTPECLGQLIEAAAG